MPPLCLCSQSRLALIQNAENTTTCVAFQTSGTTLNTGGIGWKVCGNSRSLQLCKCRSLRCTKPRSEHLEAILWFRQHRKSHFEVTFQLMLPVQSPLWGIWRTWVSELALETKGLRTAVAPALLLVLSGDAIPEGFWRSLWEHMLDPARFCQKNPISMTRKINSWIHCLHCFPLLGNSFVFFLSWTLPFQTYQNQTDFSMRMPRKNQICAGKFFFFLILFGLTCWGKSIVPFREFLEEKIPIPLLRNRWGMRDPLSRVMMLRCRAAESTSFVSVFCLSFLKVVACSPCSTRGKRALSFRMPSSYTWNKCFFAVWCNPDTLKKNSDQTQLENGLCLLILALWFSSRNLGISPTLTGKQGTEFWTSVLCAKGGFLLHLPPSCSGNKQQTKIYSLHLNHWALKVLTLPFAGPWT